MTSASVIAGVASLSDEFTALAERVRAGVVVVQVGDRGIGSGTIWHVGPADADGQAEATLLTNAHVVGAIRGAPLTVQLADKRQLAATVAAIDPGHDLAALHVKAAGLAPLEIGDSQALRVGELVLAVGNPYGHTNAVTVGVVGARAPADPEVGLEPVEPAKPTDRQPAAAPQRTETPGQPHRFGREGRRSQMEFIQADIRLYPGNSGGPLVDARGRVVGINAMVGGGLAFAIPSRVVQHFLNDVQQITRRIYLGVQMLTVPLNPQLRQPLSIHQETAALIMTIETGSLAETAGLLVGDLVLAIDGQTIQDARQIPHVLSSTTARGLPATLLVLRSGKRLEVVLQPAIQEAA